MKIHIISVFLILSFSLACNIASKPGVTLSGKSKTESRPMTGFKKIKAENAVTLDVNVQKSFEVSVEADETVLPDVMTAVRNDTLVISLKDNITTSASKITVHISMPDLSDLSLLGATTGTVNGVKTDEFELNATGASNIKIAGEAKSLKVKAVGASSVDAENLKAEKAEVESIGASHVIVNASDELKADAIGASSVAYIGEPKDLKQNASDVSTINKK